MTDSAFRGPVSNVGSMMDLTVQPDDGPSYEYQGSVLANIRAGAFNKDGTGNARIQSFFNNPTPVTVDGIPSASSTTVLATATSLTSGTALTLLSVAPGNATASVRSHATGMPFIPFGSSTVQNVIALDFGFTTGTTTAGASTIVVVDNTMFTVGQWLAIGGAGNSAKTLSQLTQVQSIVAGGTTAITVSPAPLGSLANAPIGSANLFNSFLPPATQFGPGTPLPTAESVNWAAGVFRCFNPLQALARNVVIASITSVGGTVTVSGFDVHGQQMSETLTVAAGTATLTGAKAFKYIVSVTPNFTDTTGRYSVGVGSKFGMPFRMDKWEYTTIRYAGANALNQTGFTAAVLTNPATATTGDVRGTVDVSALTTIGAAPDGSQRLWISQAIPLWNSVTGTPINTAPIFGVTQS